MLGMAFVPQTVNFSDMFVRCPRIDVYFPPISFDKIFFNHIHMCTLPAGLLQGESFSHRGEVAHATYARRISLLKTSCSKSLQVTPSRYGWDETYILYVTVVWFSFISFPTKIWFSSSLGIDTWRCSIFLSGALLKQKGGGDGEKIPGEEPSKK